MQCVPLFVCLLVATGIAQGDDGGKGTCSVSSCSIGSDSGSYQLDACFQEFANSTRQSIIIPLGDKCVYNLSVAINFSNRTHFELVGCDEEECVDGAMIECTDENAGLFFHNVTTVTVRHIGFFHCNFDTTGFVHTAHKRSSNDDDHTAALYVECAKKLVLDDIIISGTHGVGLMLYSVNTAEVTNSRFIANGLRETSHNNSSGGVHVFAPWTNSRERRMVEMYFYCQQSSWPTPSYHFTSCTFQDNYALGVPINSPQHTPNSDTYISGRGGGLSFYLTDYTQNVTIQVSHCVFKNNEALFGAGLSIFLHGAANHNTIWITDTNFTGNRGYTYNKFEGIESGGGGVQVMLTTHQFNGIPNVTNNRVTFQHCKFTNNSAYWGGGLSIVSAYEHTAKSDRGTNDINIKECEWSRNRAGFGSAIDCVSWDDVQDGVLPVVTLKGNQIYNNTVKYRKSANRHMAGAGTLYTDSIPINLEGRNTFSHNDGPGITAVDVILNFTSMSDTDFSHNIGNKGGALALFGKAQVMLCARSNVTFDHNRAKLMGGAIFYRLNGPRNLITSEKCFIQYENRTLPPDEWDTNVTFSCNHAFIDGDSVFTSSLLPCVWTGGFYGPGLLAKQSNLQENLKKVFRWSNAFIFSNINCNCNSTENHTEVSTHTANADSEIEHIEASPGMLVDQKTYSKYLKNEVGEVAYSVFRGVSQNKSIGQVQAAARYISQMRARFEGQPYTRFKIKLTSPWTLSYIITSEVNLTACPPGFTMAESKGGEQGQCECSVESENHYSGILYCTYVSGSKNRHAQLQKSYWAGYLRKGGSTPHGLCTDNEVKYSPDCYFVTGRCVRGFCSTVYDSVSQTTSLPATPSNAGINQVLCDNQHRTGILCGRCKRGYGYNINNVSECIPCSGSSTADYVAAGMVWITVRFLPLTIMVAVFLLFDIDILSGSMQSFIFYSQMLRYLAPLLNKTLTIATQGVKEIQDISFMLYDIWRLKFTGAFLSRVTEGRRHVCAGQWNILALLSLDYLPALYPLSLIFGLWCLKGLQERCPGSLCTPCLRLLRRPYIMLLRLRRKWSPNSTIIHGLSAFIVFSYTSFLTISTYLVSPSWLLIEEGVKNSCRVASDGNMPYGGEEHLPYLICALLVMFTFVAIPPLTLILVPLVPRAAVHLQPERSSRLIWLCDKLFSGPKWQFFLDAFQGGFKPKYSFFAGLLFLYRIIITVTYSFTVTLEWQYFIHTGEVVLFLVIHSLCQPYRHKIHNIVDTLIYFNMLAVLQIGNFMWQQSRNGDEIPPAVFWLALIVMNIPQMCFVGYLVYKMVRGIRRFIIRQRVKRKLKESVRRGRQSSEERDLELMNDSFQLRIDYAKMSDDFASQMAL